MKSLGDKYDRTSIGQMQEDLSYHGISRLHVAGIPGY
jgi:hypothetical protein